VFNPDQSEQFIMMTHRSTLRKAITIYSTTVLVLCTTSPAWAWGRLGHRVISRLAEQHLSEKAKVGIAGLLAEGESLADASTWADNSKDRHFVVETIRQFGWPRPILPGASTVPMARSHLVDA
jgi:hypothetical protein